ncbi:MAG TPA: SDR family oxidoreductase [Rhizomicrobium sp.]|jgi:3-oxoacyl-[acyl-carrier protein] reductase|nr:SDR family oxidoreductase [Rhizomicrobium sp.]
MGNSTPRKVLVAGASAGIGLGIARAFAEDGATLFLGGRNDQALAQAAQQFRGATPLVGDFSDSQAIGAALKAAGPLDVLVACYGDTDTPPGFDTDDAGWDRMVNANLSGPFRLAREAARQMKDQGHGAILFIGSICGHEVLGAPVGYNAGKAALRAVTKTMARELGPFGVRVNMISPGNVIFEGGRWARKRGADPARVAQMLDTAVPLRRFGTPQDIAAAALFLCSEQASFITGTDLIVDGGQTTGF